MKRTQRQRAEEWAEQMVWYDNGEVCVGTGLFEFTPIDTSAQNGSEITAAIRRALVATWLRARRGR